MDFNSSFFDDTKRTELHTTSVVKQQLQIKNAAQADLIKALDELAVTVDSNADRIRQLKETLNDDIVEDRKQLIADAISKYESLSDLTKRISEIYVMLLDIYTYGTYCMLAKDEWDWRAFARHIYTLICEHPKSVNTHLNIIIKTLQTHLGERFDLTSLFEAKKDFSQFINDNIGTAKEIRVKADAHFDTIFTERLRLIQNLSYSAVIELYTQYISKMHGFLRDLKPALVHLRSYTDISYHFLKTGTKR